MTAYQSLGLVDFKRYVQKTSESITNGQSDFTVANPPIMNSNANDVGSYGNSSLSLSSIGGLSEEAWTGTGVASAGRYQVNYVSGRIVTDGTLTSSTTATYKGSLFGFSFPKGFEPLNENHAPTFIKEEVQIYNEDLAPYNDYGLGVRPVVLQCRLEDIASRWRLSSALADRRVKKLYGLCLDEEFYCYGVGYEPRHSRDVAVPLHANFLAGFEARDPKLYRLAISTATGSANVITVDLSSSYSTYLVRPCFWITGGASSNITSVTIVDDNNGKLVYTPTSAITSGITHIIAPYFNTWIIVTGKQIGRAHV